MKRAFFLLALTNLLMWGCSPGSNSNRSSPADRVEFSSESLELAIDYSRPFKKDRLIFGDKGDGALVPYGEIWRTGANEATELYLGNDVIIGEEEVKAGTYSIYSIPDADSWIIAINSKTDYWGRGFFGSPFEEEMDVVRVEVPAQSLDETIEQFTIEIVGAGSQAEILFMWENTMIRLPVKS